MSAVLNEEAVCAAPTIVIVGSGPVGVRVAQQTLRRMPDCRVVLYGNEPWEPYNRVRLSSFLAGEVKWSALLSDTALPDHPRLLKRYGCEVVSIDREARCVRDAAGREQPYDQLVLALGSTPHIPELPGIGLSGVYAFRDFGHAQQLFARRIRTRRTIVLGGGLLGIEAARAMRRFNTEVTVLEHSHRLMARQLDDEAAALLQKHVEDSGIEVVLGDPVRTVLGTDRVEGVLLRSGRRIDCDTLIVATGIRPNIELARAAGLNVSRGIRADDHLRTNDPAIYAVGECVEHRNRIYGLVAPGFEQAAVAVENMTGNAVSYGGSLSATRLKVVGMPVFSMGAVGETDKLDLAQQWRYSRGECYRKVVIERGRLIGAIAVGDGGDIGRLQEAVLQNRLIRPWQRWRFSRTGALWAEDEQSGVADWPANVTVCNCMSVSCGRLREAMNDGCATVEALAASTSASTVCGSCKPLLVELLGGTAVATPVRAARPLGWGAAAAVLLCALLLIFAWPYAQSVHQSFNWDLLWRESFWKQVSGFSLLGLSAVAAVLSLRKRWWRLRLFDFALWRVAHLAIGVLALLTLLIHTGGRMGDQLNFWLSASFIGLAFAGAAGAWIVAREHALPAGRARRWRERLLWSHILLIWPMPVLLGFHVLKTYYF